MKKILLVVLMGASVGAFADSYSQTYTQCMDKSEGITVEMLDCIAAEAKLQTQD